MGSVRANGIFWSFTATLRAVSFISGLLILFFFFLLICTIILKLCFFFVCFSVPIFSLLQNLFAFINYAIIFPIPSCWYILYIFSLSIHKCPLSYFPTHFAFPSLPALFLQCLLVLVWFILDIFWYAAVRDGFYSPQI